MAWDVVTNFNKTENASPGYVWIRSDGYLCGHYYLNYSGTLYKDSGDASHYRIKCTLKVAPVYSGWGGYWRGNSGNGITVSFNGNVIHSQQVNLPLSAYETANSYSTVGSFDKEFYITASGTLDISMNVFYGGAGRVGSPIYIDGVRARYSNGFSGTYSNFIDFVIPDPYKPPSYDIVSVSPIGKLDRDSFTVKYKISGGTNNLSWVHGDVLNTSNVYQDVWYDFGTDKGDPVTKTFSPTTASGLKHGTEYRIRIAFHDGNSRYETGTKTFYTYQEPKLTGISRDKATVNANNQSITFTLSGINNRAWSSYEDNFYTEAYCSVGSTVTGNGWTKVGTAGTSNTFTLSGSTLRSFVTKAYDGQTITMHARRVNEKANWKSAEKTTTFTVYYKPRKGVTCANTSYRKNNSSGNGISKGSLVINDNSFTGVYISWTYDTTTADAGYTQGYRIRLYNSAGTVVKTYYTTNKYYTIPKADIPKMQNTKIDITPYFGNDQPHNASATYAANYWYFASPEKCNFIVMASKLATPTITYPIEGSNWINTKFRVCFQLPSDPDKGSELETYHYEDIELDVNGKVFRITSNPSGGTSGGVQATAVFSSTDLTYQRKMIAAPFKGSGFPSATTYKIRVRVKKKYTTDKSNWSDWSAVRTFTVEPAVFAPNRGDIIYASHYNNSKKVIDRVRNTYGVSWGTKPSDVTRGTKILRSQYPYTDLYDRIVATKKQVNNYGTFDTGHTDVRFDSTNAIKENFAQYVELVTAASNEDKSDASGRNYMKIVYDRCNRLI